MCAPRTQTRGTRLGCSTNMSAKCKIAFWLYTMRIMHVLNKFVSKVIFIAFWLNKMRSIHVLDEPFN